MQPATIRRLLVFGVCLVGVGCLYLLPSMAGSGQQARPTPARHDLPTAQPTTATPVSLTSAAANPTPAAPPTPAKPRATAPVTHQGATAVAPGQDDTAPGPVGRPTVLAANPDRLTISWPEADRADDVVSYDVWLNGFVVLSTQRAEATLAWFNDTSTHVIQVRAQDAAGNKGPSSPTLMVTRPAPPAPPSPAAPSPSATASRTTESRTADLSSPNTDVAQPPAETEGGGTEEDGS